MQKINKYIINFVIILGLISILLFIISKFYKNNHTQQIVEVKIDKYIKDIQDSTNNQVFPIVDTKLKEDYNYIINNFRNSEYVINKNKKVSFKMLLPKYFGETVNMSQEDPFESENNDYIILGEFKNKEQNIIGSIYVYTTTAEINPSDINDLFINGFKYDLLKIKYNYYVNGLSSDAVLSNPENGEITRMIVKKYLSLYYVINFTFKNFYHYMQYAKDVSIIFNSFKSKELFNKISPVDFDLKKINSYDLLFPKGWNVESEYNKKLNYEKINIKNEIGGTIFNIFLYENNSETKEVLLNTILNIIKKDGFIFDGIDEKNTVYTSNYYSVVLKNAKYNDNFVNIHFIIEEKGDKKIVSVMYTTRIEKNNFMHFRQDRRFFYIALNSLKLRLFENVNIEDTNWIKLYYKYNQK